MGHTSLELAEAAEAGPFSLRATLEPKSSFDVDSGVLEVCEDNDKELPEGDRTSALGLCC